MDKYEYKAKTEEMLRLAKDGNYKGAEAIADAIDWRRVRSVSMLMNVSSFYEYDGRYSDAREILYIAYDRNKNNKNVLFKLTELAIEEGDLEDSIDCYREYVKIADRDPNKFILEYKIAKAKGESISRQIEALEKLKNAEYTEKWAYELATLYSDAGMADKCVEECNDISLWFSDGAYVKKALLLKSKYKELTESQKEVTEQDYEVEDDDDDIQKLSELLLETNEKAKQLEAEKKDRSNVFLFGFDKNKGKQDEEIPTVEIEEEEEEEEEEESIKNQEFNLEKNEEENDLSEEELDVRSSDNLYQGEEEEEEEEEEVIKKKNRIGLGAFLFGKKNSEADEEKELEARFQTRDLSNDLEVLGEEELEDESKEDTEISSRTEELENIDSALEGIGLFGVKKNNEESSKEIIEEKVSDEYIANNVEFKDKEVNVDEPIMEEINYDDDEVKQIEAPTYDEKAEEEIKRVAAINTDRENKGENSMLDSESIERLEKKRKQDSLKVENEDLANRMYDTLDLQAEIMKGLDTIGEDIGVTEENLSSSQNVRTASSEIDMKEILPEDTNSAVEDDVVKETAEKMAEDVEEIKEEVKKENGYDDFEEETLAQLSLFESDEKQEQMDTTEAFENDVIQQQKPLTTEKASEIEEKTVENKEPIITEIKKEDIKKDSEEVEGDAAHSDDIPEDKSVTSIKEENIPNTIKEKVEQESPINNNDGRFIMEERYSLAAKARIGKEAGLTELERRIFSYFVPVSGMSNQIVDVLDIIRNANRNGSSCEGNLLITGAKGCGKTKLAISVVKVIQKEYKRKKGPVAIVNGEALNGKNMDLVMKKVYDGALVIENAGKLEKRTIKALNNAMRKETGEALVLLEDSQDNINKIMSIDKKFASMFSAKLNVPKFLNDDLVTFAQTYAKENGYRIQEMAILAIYNRIDSMQRDDHVVTVSEVAEIMDEAFEKSKKNSLKRTMTNLFKSAGEDKSLTLLMEEDFE